MICARRPLQSSQRSSKLTYSPSHPFHPVNPLLGVDLQLQSSRSPHNAVKDRRKTRFDVPESLILRNHCANRQDRRGWLLLDHISSYPFGHPLPCSYLVSLGQGTLVHNGGPPPEYPAPLRAALPSLNAADCRWPGSHHSCS
jgi:hypothetical protein